jgi:hypothetical protein
VTEWADLAEFATIAEIFGDIRPTPRKVERRSMISGIAASHSQ